MPRKDDDNALRNLRVTRAGEPAAFLFPANASTCSLSAYAEMWSLNDFSAHPDRWANGISARRGAAAPTKNCSNLAPADALICIFVSDRRPSLSLASYARCSGDREATY